MASDPDAGAKWDGEPSATSVARLVVFRTESADIIPHRNLREPSATSIMERRHCSHTLGCGPAPRASLLVARCPRKQGLAWTMFRKPAQASSARISPQTSATSERSIPKLWRAQTRALAQAVPNREPRDPSLRNHAMLELRARGERCADLQQHASSTLADASRAVPTNRATKARPAEGPATRRLGRRNRRVVGPELVRALLDLRPSRCGFALRIPGSARSPSREDPAPGDSRPWPASGVGPAFMPLTNWVSSSICFVIAACRESALCPKSITCWCTRSG